MRIKNTDLEIMRGDITTLAVDAVVNPANPALVPGAGLAKAIREKGGPRVEAEALKQAPVAPGGAVVTTGGDLPAKNVIHAVTVDDQRATDQDLLRRAAANAIRLADAMQFKTVAFPALGCGAGGFDPVGAAKIFVQELFKVCQHTDTGLEKVIVCLYDEATFQTFDKTIRGYLRHLQEDLGPGPYVTADIIIELADDLSEGDDGIVIIERSNPPYGYALPGGFLDYGESLEDAARREAREETGLELADLRQFHTYSVMGRDPRFQTVSTVFIARGSGKARAGDDAKGLRVIPYGELLDYEYAFDHQEVIRDYLEVKARENE